MIRESSGSPQYSISLLTFQSGRSKLQEYRGKIAHALDALITSGSVQRPDTYVRQSELN